jgi:hypothetical protein
MQTRNDPYDRRSNRGFEPANGDTLDLEQRDSHRRRTYRLPLRLWTEGRAGGALDFHNCSNLSEVGMFVEKPTPYPLQTLVQLEFNLPGIEESIKIAARVVSMLDEHSAGANIMGNGFVFEGIAPADQKLIKTFMTARQQQAP